MPVTNDDPIETRQDFRQIISIIQAKTLAYLYLIHYESHDCKYNEDAGLHEVIVTFRALLKI